MHTVGSKLFWLYLFCYTISVAGQNSIITYDLINEDDGMRTNNVLDVLMDSRGLVWIATTDGLHRYDGYSFTIYDNQPESPVKLSSNNIFSLAEDEKGRIWVGTDNGVNVLNPVNHNIIRYFNLGNNIFPPSNTKEGKCQVLQSQNGSIWIVEGGFLRRFRNGKFEYLHKEKINGISKIYSSKNNNLYIKTESGQSLLLSNEKTISEIPYFDKAKDSFSLLSDLSFDNKEKGLVFVHYFRNIFLTYDEKTKRIETLLPEESALTGVLLNLLNNKMDLNSPNFGKTQDNILYNITKITQDKNGLFWVATNIGLVKISIQESHFHTLPELKRISLRGMYEHPNGRIYVGAYAPLDFFSFNPKNDSIRKHNVTDVWAIKPYKKDTLVLLSSNSTSITLFDVNKEKVVFHQKYPESMIWDARDLIVLEDGNIIVGSASCGLFATSIDQLDDFHRFEPSNSSPPLNKPSIHSFFQESDSILWAGSTNSIIKINLKSKFTKRIKIPVGELVHANNREIFDIHRSESNLFWLATTKGLIAFEPYKNEAKVYTTREGIADNLIYTVLPEDSNYIWAATNNGLSRLEIATGAFSNFLEEDGISYREFNRNSSMIAKDGKLYFGGISGITSFHPKELKYRKADFSPLISCYIVFDKEKNRLVEYVPSGQAEQTVYLNSEQNNITFTLANSDYNKPARANFEVQLLGLDKDWIHLGNKRVMRYTNLNPGSYIFKVRGANEDGIWSEKTASLKIIATAPFYTSTWFYTLLALIFFLGIGSFFYFRLAYERKSNRLRNRIANDLHDEVSNTLNNIRIASNDAAIADPKLNDTLNRIMHMSSNAIEHVEDVIWAIDQEKKTMKYLLFRMEDNIDNLLRLGKIPVQFEKINLNEDAKLDFLHRRNLLLIFKETLSNIVKHTYSENVIIRIGNQNGKFFLEVSNTYSKKKKPRYKTGRGTISMTQRATALKGNLIVTEKEGSYTVVLEKKEVL